ncbi:PHP domain-containing protein [Klebsiella oxytoca]|nr:hypothetical protein HMPREF9694_05548 [Klebsiella michiganensis]
MDKIDLHIHSSYSNDADFPVSEIFNLAEKNDLSLISITDHNSSRSALDGVNYCVNKKIGFITGIEVDCSFNNRNFHLLGYGYNKDTLDFDCIESDFIKSQIEATPIKIKLLKDLGFYFDEDELYIGLKGSVPQEESMAELILLDERNAGNALLLPYREGGERSDMPLVNFFWDFFGIGKPCHVEIKYPELAMIADVIKDNGGIPVIAHIGANVEAEHLKFITEMNRVGVDGVEVFSSYHNMELSKTLFDYCVENSLFITCGSDFHGANKPNITIGSCKYNSEELMAIQKLTDRVNIY